MTAINENSKVCGECWGFGATAQLPETRGDDYVVVPCTTCLPTCDECPGWAVCDRPCENGRDGAHE